MDSYTQEELQSALKVVSSTISNCEKIQRKFREGMPQFSLLRNRIKALKISKFLINKDDSIMTYTIEDLKKALPPVNSIINKTEKAQRKYDEDSPQYRRFTPIIEAMNISKSLIANEIRNRNLV